MDQKEMKSSTPMLLVYDGPAVEDHKIPVEVLAESLMALNRIASTTNKELFKNGATVSLSVHALKQGSFGVELVLDSTILEQLRDLLSGDTATAIANGKTIVEILLGVFLLHKWLKGRNPTKIERLNNEETKVFIKQEVLTVHNNTFVIHQATKDDCDKFLEPLDRDGIQNVTLSSAKQEFSLSQEEFRQFEREPTEDILSENTARVYVQVDSPNFKQDKKWRCTFNGQSIMATVTDEDFVQRVDTHLETFGAGDILECDLLTRQILKEGKITPYYEISKVHQHKEPPFQIKMSL